MKLMTGMYQMTRRRLSDSDSVHSRTTEKTCGMVGGGRIPDCAKLENLATRWQQRTRTRQSSHQKVWQEYPDSTFIFKVRQGGLHGINHPCQ